jgi:dihydroorotate dehydrogenase electron transfer subunit
MKKMSPTQIKAKIISNRRLSENYRLLEFESGLIAKHAVAGQFVNIRVSDGAVPLLRRPISIHGVKALKIKIIYEILGPGTQILASRKPGEFLDIIGPLGNGFNYRAMVKSGRARNILIAGGLGVAPLVLIGAKTKKGILCSREFKALGCELKIATDNGSRGFKGKVTDLFKAVLEQAKPAQIFSCGPQPMLKAVAQIARDCKINAQFSLEEHMACGIGACLGCVVATKGGYKTVCKDGPVFSSEELIW